MKAEKFDVLNQMKQLYATLEDKEKELREFIRAYEKVSLSGSFPCSSSPIVIVSRKEVQVDWLCCPIFYPPSPLNPAPSHFHENAVVYSKKKNHRLPFSTRRGKHTTLEPHRHTLIDVLHASSPVEAHRESGSRLIKRESQHHPSGSICV